MHSNCVGVTSPGGANAAARCDWSKLAGRDVVVWPDNDEPGQKYAEKVYSKLQEVGVNSVHVVVPPSDAPTGWDVADALSDGWTSDRVSEAIDAAASEPSWKCGHCREDKDEPADGGEKMRSRRDLALQLVDDVEFWHDNRKVEYASFRVNGHIEHCRIRERSFRHFIIGRFFEATGGAIGGQALEDCIRVCEAKATSWGKCHTVYKRVGEHAGDLYIDLTNDDWQAVRVHKHGFETVSEPPIKFIRASTSLPLPHPEEGYDVDCLRSFLNVASDEDFILAVAWLLGAMRPSGPYPLLSVSGEQGTGKSGFTEFMTSIADPGIGKKRTFPRDERDLIITAQHEHVLLYDNLSGIAHWFSDALCRLSTGGGLAARRLHTDDELMVLPVQCPVILNGIPDLVGRPDLASRSIALQLRRFEAGERKTEQQLKLAFEADKPKILGALCDGLSAGLRNLETTNLTDPPRMADFARWVEACASGIGWEPGQFLDAYSKNQQDISETAIEAEPLAIAILQLLADRREGWEGTPTELLSALNDVSTDFTRNSRRWPRSVNALGTAMKRIAPMLPQRGFDIEFIKSGSRLIRIIPRQVSTD
jgi:hypothetical protein